MRLEPATLPATDLVLVLAEPSGQLRLSQAEAPANGQKPFRNSFRGGLGFVAEEGIEDRVPPHGRLRPPQFP